MEFETLSYEEQLEFFKNYEIGQLRSIAALPPSKNLKDKKKLSLGVFGFTGHGKSSLINLLLCAIRGPKKSFELTQSSENDDSSIIEGIRNYQQFNLHEKIDLYDSRGLQYLNMDNREEILNFILGKGSKHYICRPFSMYIEAEKKLIERFGKNFINNKTTEKLDGIIIVINAFVTKAGIESAKKLIDILNNMPYNSYVIAITKIDKLEGNKTFQEHVDSQRQKFSSLLGVDGNLIFPLYCYEREYQQRNVEETDTQALLLLKNALKQAELNADFEPPPQSWWTLFLKEVKDNNLEPLLFRIFFLCILVVIGFLSTKPFPEGQLPRLSEN